MQSNAKALDTITAKLVTLCVALTTLVAGAVAFLAVSAGSAEALPAYARRGGRPDHG